jgi:hypothetical protein
VFSIRVGNQTVFEIACGFKNFARYIAGAVTIIAT